MKPIKVMRYSGSFRYNDRRKKQIWKLLLAIFLSLVVIGAAFFTVYAISSITAGSDSDDGDLTEELVGDTTTEMSMAGGVICMLTLPDGVDVRDVTFSTSDAAVARVDAAGRVDGISKGDATITASCDYFSAQCVFHIGAQRADAEPSEVTTAYRANEEIRAANEKKGRDNLYRITVNRRTNTVTVYTYDSKGNYTIPVRAMVCSCGSGGSNVTPVGDFRTASMRDWAALFGDATHEFLYGQYVTEFNGDILFHSVPYEQMAKNSLETAEFNKLGANASQGCVRLMVADCLWIYTNCPLNTPVSVIDADASADPLGTPPAVQLNYQNGWDPTDPDPKNPYKGKRPRIIDIDDVTVSQGADFDPLDGVIARDICGNRITKKLKITGEVITDKPGVYYLTYTVTDDFGLTQTATRTVTVK